MKKQEAREQAITWWLQKGVNSAKCDICAGQVSRNEGYLLRSGDMLQSDSYVNLCCDKMGKNVIQSSGIPGIDSMVMRAVMPAARVAVREKAIDLLRNQTTPWFVCERCLALHFPESDVKTGITYDANVPDHTDMDLFCSDCSEFAPAATKICPSCGNRIL